MDKHSIKALIIENQTFVSEIELIHRHLDLETNTNYVFVGLRRAGKSYLLYQIIQDSLKKGTPKEQILYINFEDERLIGLKTEDLNIILEIYAQTYDYKPILYLDEIQVVNGWQKFVRRLADSKYTLFVTGSNAEMLSGEIATTLGGRFFIKEVYPYSLQDYLNVKNITLTKNWKFSKQRNLIFKTADNYLKYGGLPEVTDKKNKRDWISNLYQYIYYGDLITRYSIRNEKAIKLMIKKLADSIMQPISYNRLANIVSSSGSKISVSSISEYIKYASNVWLLFSINNFASSFTEKESIKKYYFIDNGILNLFLYQGQSPLLENIMAISLYHYYKDDLFFYNKNIEVDFYIPSEKLAIQVSYSIEDSSTLEREIKALLKLNKITKLKRAILITYNTEKEIVKDDLKIEVIPFWIWLLSFSK